MKYVLQVHNMRRQNVLIKLSNLAIYETQEMQPNRSLTVSTVNVKFTLDVKTVTGIFLPF